MCSFSHQCQHLSKATSVALTQQHALCTCVQVAAIGFCMGAALAIAASQYGKIHAAVGCYGLPQYDICPVSSTTHAVPENVLLYL